MAEFIATFSALSSILQVVQFVAKLTSHTHKLISSEKNALADNLETESLAREFKSFASPNTDGYTGRGGGSEQAISRLRRACENEADDLLKQLEALKISPDSKGTKRIKEGTRKAIRAIGQRKQIDSRRSYLLELNGLLATSMLDSLLEKHQEQVSQTLALFDKSAEMTNEAKLTNLEQAVSKIEPILKKLEFKDMRMRENNIGQAYPRTYHWALEDEACGLRPWLRAGNGIFWINGKAGSGKSTLIKFLCSSNITRELLREWSEEHPLVMAKFYFWYLGTTSQKSIPGLLQTILHQILSERIDLVPIAFASCYNAPAPPYVDNTQPFTTAQLLEGLHRIAAHESIGSNRKKFCLFIDGLDEYHGNHLELVGILRELERNPDFKLCVSSRPWNAFRNAFENSVPSIRLEDLTRTDIFLYVNGRIQITCQSLGSNAYVEDQDITALVDDITQKAEGVFLWVHLVVKSVLDGLAEMDDIDFLRHRVQTIPSDLDEFFHNILLRVGSAYKWHTSQAPKLAILYTDAKGDARELPSWIDHWLLKQDPRGFSDPAFVYRVDVQQPSWDKWQQMVRETRTFLSAACKDLLWMPRGHKDEDFDPFHFSGGVTPVQFLHRTVYDFLHTERMHDWMQAQLPPHFKDGRISHLLNLARLKYIVPGPLFDAAGFTHANSHGKVEYVECTGSLSIASKHPDLCTEFVRHFEDVALHYVKLYQWSGNTLDESANWMSEPAILAALVAFKCTIYVKSALEVLMSSTWYRFPDGGLNKILVAAIGELRLNKFGLHEADLELTGMLLDYGVDISYRSTEDHHGCSHNLWQVFLRKLALSTDLQCDLSDSEGISQPSELNRLNTVWTIAMQFLRCGLSIEEVVCTRPSGSSVEEHHSFNTTAADILKQYIPLLWLRDFGDTRLTDHIS